MKTRSTIIAGIIALAASSLQAQIPGANIPPRTDDHFQRRLVVNRIDLSEKVNQPLVSVTDQALYDAGKYGEQQGLVAALIHGLKSGKYLAYNSDNLTESMTYEDVVALSQRCNMNNVEPEEWPVDDPFLPEIDEIEEIEDIEDVDGNERGGSVDGMGGGKSDDGTDGVAIAPLESSIEFIENRIFDKNRSAEIYDIQYIRLVWVDPGETLPDKNFVCFKFSDVLETLEDTRWANKHNDAEDRNLREVFEERIFNSFVTNVSGNGVRTLPESAFRTQQMLQFEHELWNY